MTYDLEEATSILAKAHMDLDHTALASERRDAAIRLLEGLGAAAESAGCETRLRDDGTLLEVTVGARTAFAAFDKHSLTIKLGTSPYATPLVEAAIDFDAGRHIFIGRESDTFRNPLPGGPWHVKRAAAAVVAEGLAQRLAASFGA